MKERSYLMDELGDPDAPVGSKLWCLYVSNEIRKTYYDKTQLGARLKNLVEAFTEQQGWQELGFLTWEKYCEARLHIAAEKLETEARNRVAERVAEIDENARPLAEAPGGDKKSEQYKNHSYNHKNDFSENAGTNADYLIARIARDNPEILEGMKQGKYRSVRAAAIDAGIIDPNKTRRHQLPTDPTAAGQYLAKRVDAEWMATMLEAYQDARVS